MILLAVTLYYLTLNRDVCGQWHLDHRIIMNNVHEDSINFYRQKESANPVAINGTFNRQASLPPIPCACYPAGGCNLTVPGSNERIVNKDHTAFGCPLNFPELCCYSPETTTMKTTSATIATTTTTTARSIKKGCGYRKVEIKPDPVEGRASFGAYPWQAVFTDAGGKFIASGAIIHPIYILTSASKVIPYRNNVNGILARLGMRDLSKISSEDHLRVAVAHIEPHPGFDRSSLINNLAIVRLNADVNLSFEPYKHINTVCRPTGPPQAGARCFVSGWGKNLYDPWGAVQDVMREVDVPLVDVNECEKSLRGTRLGVNFQLNKESFMCAGGESAKDACTGDGGAPLVCEKNDRWFVVGLVSWGIGCGTQGIPGVYTNVYNFLNWIDMFVPVVP